jgi:hypothetical protein
VPTVRVRANVVEHLVDPQAVLVVDEEVSGACPALRAELEARQVGYVLAVACDHPVRVGGAACRADALLTRVPAGAWRQGPPLVRLGVHPPGPPGLVGLTCNELQHLFAALLARPAGDLGHRLR